MLTQNKDKPWEDLFDLLISKPFQALYENNSNKNNITHTHNTKHQQNDDNKILLIIDGLNEIESLLNMSSSSSSSSSSTSSSPRQTSTSPRQTMTTATTLRHKFIRSLLDHLNKLPSSVFKILLSCSMHSNSINTTSSTPTAAATTAATTATATVTLDQEVVSEIHNLQHVEIHINDSIQMIDLRDYILLQFTKYREFIQPLIPDIEWETACEIILLKSEYKFIYIDLFIQEILLNYHNNTNNNNRKKRSSNNNNNNNNILSMSDFNNILPQGLEEVSVSMYICMYVCIYVYYKVIEYIIVYNVVILILLFILFY